MLIFEHILHSAYLRNIWNGTVSLRSIGGMKLRVFVCRMKQSVFQNMQRAPKFEYLSQCKTQNQKYFNLLFRSSDELIWPDPAETQKSYASVHFK
jgi:hypothetical protein